MRYLFMKRWIESERGWGQNFIGVSLHISEDDYNVFAKRHWDKYPDRVPDYYIGPDAYDKLKEVNVTEELYQEVLATEDGKRYSGTPDGVIANR